MTGKGQQHFTDIRVRGSNVDGVLNGERVSIAIIGTTKWSLSADPDGIKTRAYTEAVVDLACLIAAARQVLEALRAALDSLETWHEHSRQDSSGAIVFDPCSEDCGDDPAIIEQARAAIKAGEGDDE